MRGLALVVARLAIVAGLVGLLELLCRGGAISGTVMPPPSDIARNFGSLVSTSQFRSDLWRTVSEILTSCVVGITAGLLVGIACGQRKLVGETLEPYLVSLYAMPTLAFYPLLLGFMGLGSGPIVVITSIMTAVPVALNTMIGIREISPTLKKLARSLNCSRRKTYLSIWLPAATPLVFPGIKLGSIYAIIGAIAMEFVLANAGLGYRIGYDYGNFSAAGMWANILAVIIISMTALFGLAIIERQIRRDLA